MNDVFGVVSFEFLSDDLLCSVDPLLIPGLLFEIFEFVLWVKNFKKLIN